MLHFIGAQTLKGFVVVVVVGLSSVLFLLFVCFLIKKERVKKAQF